MNKQLEIQRYLHTVPFASLDEIYENVTFSYYHNYKKHLGNIMSRMVKNGKVKRIKKGVFKYVSAMEYIKSVGKINMDNTQPSLFDAQI